MNKLFTKIAALVLGMTMAVGVGVAVGANKNSAPVFAADQTAKWTATSGGLGSGIGSGTITDDKSFSWSYTRTLSSGVSYTGWTSNCIQLGKNGGVEHLTLTTSNIPGTIKSVSVECSSYNNAHKVSISVGDVEYLEATNTAKWTTVGTNTGTGTSSGTITISFTNGTRALYIKSISVVYNNDAPTPTKSLSSIAVTSTDHRTFTQGDEFVKETITATYDDESTKDVTSDAIFSGYNMSNVGEQTVNVSYTEGEITKSASYTINVKAPKALSSITLSGTYPTSFFTGDEFSHTGMTVTATFDDESTDDVTESATFSGYNMATAGNQTVTVSYEYASVTKTATYGITVVDRILTGITLSGQTTSYSKNASFSFNGTCTASYSNAPDRVVTPTSVSSPDMSTVGTKEVTISYTENEVTKEAKYDITVTKDPKPGSTVYTLDGTITGGTSGYAAASDITQNNVKWSVTGNTTTNPWRIGGKSLSGVDRELYSVDSIESSVAQIDLQIGNITITVNSVILTVASDDSFTNVIDTVNVSISASSTSTISPSSLSQWPEESFYKITFNVTESTSSNTYIQFEGAEFKASGKYSAEIQGPDSVNAGSEWAATGVIDEELDPVSNVTYTFAASGVTITSSSSSGTFTATGTGKVIVSADAGSMYEITSKEVTVIGEDPTITPSTETAGGYAGQEQTVSFVYANLDNNPTVVSNDEEVVTISDLTYSEGSGSVKLNFAGPGTDVDVYFKDGENTLATVVVNVETPVVTISEAAISVAQGHEKGLTATSSYGIIDWECDCVTSDVEVVVDLQHSNNATVRVSQSATIGFKAKVTAYITAYPAAKAECVVTVTEVIEYTKATNINQLWNGQKVVIGNASGSVIANAYDGSSNNVKGYTTSGESSAISEEDATNACVYTLNQVVYDSDDEDNVVDSMAWTLFDGKNYLYAASTSANYLKGKTEVDADCYWDITFSNDELVVVSVENKSRPNMRYNPNNGSPIFSCYASGQSAIAFYVLDANSDGTSAAKAFVDSYMHMDSETEGQCLGYYPIAKVVWNKLDSAAKAKVESDKPAAFKRLQDWAAANGDHIDGDSNIVANTRISIFGNVMDNNNAIAIVVIVSVVSLTAIGGYFFLRKKREQN